ncbi:GntR family transcriptional regulator [Neobacillus vireti]|uniref:GntR family transcriptional regulator n=1 Tax=Neobacillus vireti TaxID=220686 RepID=UPI003000982C
MKSPKPLYVQLKEMIKKDIDTGKYAKDNKLPTEKEMVDMYNISRITIRRALTELEREGLVQKQHGIGTFVTNNKKFKRDLISVTGFSEFLVQTGKQPETKIILTEVLKASNWISEILNVPIKEPVLEVRRLHLIEGDPVHLETSYYSLRKFPDLDQHISESNSIYNILKDRYSMKAVKNHKTLAAVFPTLEQAKLLQLTQDHIVFEVEKWAYDHKGEVIHFAKSYLPADKVSWTITNE